MGKTSQVSYLVCGQAVLKQGLMISCSCPAASGLIIGGLLKHFSHWMDFDTNRCGHGYILLSLIGCSAVTN